MTTLAEPIPPGLTERRRANLKRLLKPRHVAYVGGRAMEVAIRECVGAGFQGPVWAVNPKYESLGGVPCFPSVEALPEPPDATFVAVPREATIAIVRALRRAGAGGAVCYAAGYAEVGGAGEALQERLVAAAGELALIGPNCYGILNYLDGVTLWPIENLGSRVARGAAFVAQSGNLALNLTNNRRSVPFAYVISTGNQAVLDLGDVIDVLLDDAAVTAIGVYLEAINDIPAFARAAARALVKGVPVVALKAGTSEIGRRIALTHTSSLAGSDAMYEALFRRFAVARVGRPAALLEALKLLSVTGPLAGPRLAVLTCSGAEAAIVADAAAEAGIALPPPSPEQVTRLAALLPDFAIVANPLDYNTSLWGDRAGLEGVFTTLMAEGYDAALLVIDYFDKPRVRRDVDAAVEALIAASRSTRVPAMIASSIPESVPADAQADLIARGIAPMQDSVDAIGAIGAAVRFAARRRMPNPVRLVPPPVPPPPRNPVTLDEGEAKRRLVAFGLTVPAGRAVALHGVATAVAEVGPPVALKVLNPMLAHKSEAGAVRVRLAGPEAALAAAREMAERLGARRFLVEAMVTDGVCELLIGVTRDAHFGQVMLLGAGGVMTEALGDVATLLFPVDRAEAAEALARLRIARLLAGFRGRPKGDTPAVLSAVESIARFAEAHRESLDALDVNPLIVRPEGCGAVAADALIRLTPTRGDADG